MKPRAIVLSGKVCSGKTSLASNLELHARATLIASKDLIVQQFPKTKQERSALKRAGDRLERESKGRWLADQLNRRLMSEAAPPTLVVLDAVRTSEQVRYLRESGWLVTHVHLDASPEELERRFASSPHGTQHTTYEELSKSWPERPAGSLRKIADVVIDTDRCCADDVFARVFARLEVRPATAMPLVDVLVGGQYGSEGKGNIAHYLAPEYDILVRVGGPNAGHKVYRAGEEPYTFHQLPSGALANSDATLVLGAGAVIGLEHLLREISELSIQFDQLVIDPQAMIINADDIVWEKEHLLKEIASTAQGVGSATARKILWRLPETNVRLARDTPALKHYLGDTVEFFGHALSSGKKIMLEGTQGTSLSLHHGPWPHVTSRVTTAAGCLAEAGLTARHVRRVLMVCRTYPIRVSNTDTGKTSGPMSRQLEYEVVAARSRIPIAELKKTEMTSTTKRQRRIGEFDWAQLRRSLILNGPTDIALTFADYFGIENRDAYRYEQLSEETVRFIEELEKVSGIPVSMISTAFNDRNIIDRRMW